MTTAQIIIIVLGISAIFNTAYFYSKTQKKRLKNLKQNKPIVGLINQ